ncbi:polyhydroxyalkanoate depolymerase [Mobilicoccus sp.]|uniref:polyhydroxyalkanoate depolymerase n=1 Tax=Mobilicoccus sp. TaxID=2034349 RepID=UPI0028AC461A|nr:polyhydroxyalkanoate depolymerase [Mobilicoccus sp.]
MTTTDRTAGEGLGLTRDASATLWGATDRYSGPYNPWLEPTHYIGTLMMSFASVGVGLQRDWLRVQRDLGRLYGQPLPVQQFSSWLGRIADANVSLMDQLTREYTKPEFGLDTTRIDGKEVAVTERIVEARPFCNLIHFDRDTDRKDPIVLLIAPQSGHYATLLRPTVERLLPEAEVYITDWISAREVAPEEGTFDLDTYADDVRHFVTMLGPRTNVLAICQSTVPSVMAISRLAEDDPATQPATLTVMAGPLDPAAAPTDVTELADRMHLPTYLQTFIARAPNGRRVYPGYVQLMSFIAMNPQNHFSSHRDLYRYQVADDTHPEIERIERFYREYFAVADLTAEFYADTVKRVFIEKQLAAGTMEYGGRLVRPEAITCPIIGIEGSNDDISAPGQTRDFLAKFTGSDDVSFYEQEGAGHYGVFAGGHWRGDIAPRVLGKIHAYATENYSPPQYPHIPIAPYEG